MNEAVFAFIVAVPGSLITTAALLHWFPTLAEDVANHRSLHQGIIPRIGGIGVVLVALACLAWVGRDTWILALAIMSALSFCDDRYGLPSWLRLLVHALVVAKLLAETPDVEWHLGLLGGLAWVWCINLFNFMDGSDGLAGGMAAVAFASLGGAALVGGATDIAVLAWAICGAASGFLYFNLPPARVFLGDTGSISLGFLFGLLALLGNQRDIWAWWFPPCIILPFVIDATMTLSGRMLTGQAFWQPHLEHAYQKLVRMGWSQRQLLGAAYPLMILNASVVLMVMIKGRAAWLLLPFAVQVVLWVRIEKYWRKRRYACVANHE